MPIGEKEIAAVPDAIDSPDAWILGAHTPRGQEIIVSLKRMDDGTLLYLEEMRTGRKTLAMTSMRKYPGTTDFETIRDRILPSYARSDTGDVRIVYPEYDAGQSVFFSRAGATTPEALADEIIRRKVSVFKPVDAVFALATKWTGINWLAETAYNKGGFILDHITPESVKAGLISDYGVPEAVIDRRVEMQGAMKQHIRGLGKLTERLGSLTREESRVAYAWMNNNERSEEHTSELQSR